MTNLFAGTDPIGKSISIDRVSFRVVGVLAAKGASGFQDQDDLMVTPITAVWAYLAGSRGQVIQTIFAEGIQPVHHDRRAERSHGEFSSAGITSPTPARPTSR